MIAGAPTMAVNLTTATTSLLLASTATPVGNGSGGRAMESFTDFEYNFYLLSGLAGILLNIAIIVLHFLHVDTHEKPRQIIVFNMALSDLLTCNLYILIRPSLSLFPHMMCYPYYVFVVTAQLCSCLNLLWINVDKLLSIKIPLYYTTLVSRRRVLLLATFTWTWLAALVSALYWFIRVKKHCGSVELSKRIYLVICILYILMLGASFVVSTIIFYIASNSWRAKSSKEAKFKRLLFVFSSTIWTLCTCLPYRLLYLCLLIFGPPARPMNPLLRHFKDLFYMLLILGIVINPLITILTQRTYQQLALYYLSRVFCANSAAANYYRMATTNTNGSLCYRRSFEQHERSSHGGARYSVIDVRCVGGGGSQNGRKISSMTNCSRL